jgi:hypothetical protein
MLAPDLAWTGQDTFELDGVTYVCRPRFDSFHSTPDRFCIQKPPEAIAQYRDLIERLRPRAIVEVGVFEGGSAALLHQLARPDRQVAIDIADQPGPGLEGYIAERAADGSLVTAWGVDQSDRRRLDEIVAEHFEADAPLDLVVDDASHLLEESRATFNALFPRLREGGEYVLEDWSWAHAPIVVWPNRPPLSLLVFELAMACAHRPELITGLEIDRAWAVVRRGSAPVDPAAFDIRRLCGPRGRAMIDAIDGGAPTA